MDWVDHKPKYYSTSANYKGRVVLARAFSCAPCKIYGKLFGSAKSRAQFAKDHTS